MSNADYQKLSAANNALRNLRSKNAIKRNEIKKLTDRITQLEAEFLESKANLDRYEMALTEDSLVEQIYKWKFIWLDVKGTDEADRKNYFDRAYRIDANMIYSLAKIIAREALNPREKE